MNCPDIEALLSAELDGVLTSRYLASVYAHLAHCPSCAEFRAILARAMELFRHDSASVSFPDVDEEWQKVLAKLNDDRSVSRERVSLSRVLSFAAPLAAAA